MLRLFTAARVVLAIHAYGDGAPSCVSPGVGPHRTTPSQGSGGHQLRISESGEVSITQGRDPFRGFLLLLPENTDVCDLPSSAKLVDEGCGNQLGVTHAAWIDGDVRFRVGCNSNVCNGHATGYLITSFDGPWFNLSTTFPVNVASCQVDDL